MDESNSIYDITTKARFALIYGLDYDQYVYEYEAYLDHFYSNMEEEYGEPKYDYKEE